MKRQLIKRINRMRYTGLIIFLMCMSHHIQGEQLAISIFNDFNIQTAIISVINGQYHLTGDGDTIKTLSTNHVFYTTEIGNFLHISTENKHLGQFKKVKLHPLGDTCIFKVKPMVPGRPHRLYQDGLSIEYDYNKLLLINKINLPHYIAGVVRAECGVGHHPEFFKAHAIIARTYALKHRSKHLVERFHLCDGVHCQAYKGMTERENIIHATHDTKNEVLTDQDSNLITAAFHSNCGGQTQHSENVWLSHKSHLRSVIDPYCIQSTNAHWQEEINLDEWKKYLEKKQVNIDDLSKKNIEFNQYKRMKYYQPGQHKILLSDIRKDWGLRSTYFSLKIKDNKLIIDGKGYGHGVGLCQQGAMQMAHAEKDYKEIIHFYYTDVRIIDYHTIIKIENDPFFK